MNVNVWDATEHDQAHHPRAGGGRRPTARRPHRPAQRPHTHRARQQLMNRLQQLHQAGVSIWLDTLSRELLDTGAFRRLIDDSAVTGATSNPTIFAKAITGSDRYDDQLRDAVAAGVRDPQELFFELALADVGRAADLLRETYDASEGRDGFISFECTPDLADDTSGTIEQATELWNRLARPNVMIKVPATDAGIPAIEQLTARGINVNITLLFSVARYEQVIDAYMAGLERRLAPASRSTRSLRSRRSSCHASTPRPTPCCRPGRRFADGWPSPTPNARTRTIATASRTRRWSALRDAGANAQRPLWASTGTKNPAYSDVLYVEALIAPDIVNTMPEATLRAFADHGEIGAPAGRRRQRRRRNPERRAGCRRRPRLPHGRARARGRALFLRLLPTADRLHRDQAGPYRAGRLRHRDHLTVASHVRRGLVAKVLENHRVDRDPSRLQFACALAHLDDRAPI